MEADGEEKAKSQVNVKSSQSSSSTSRAVHLRAGEESLAAEARECLSQLVLMFSRKTDGGRKANGAEQVGHFSKTFKVMNLQLDKNVDDVESVTEARESAHVDVEFVNGAEQVGHFFENF